MLNIKTVNKGAELISVTLDGTQKLHDGQNFWNRHSPVLFPIVGKLKNGKTLINENIYEMGQHGFARDMDFEKISENSYVLKYNSETLKKFPFKFELYVSYEIDDNTLKTKYKVVNKDNSNIIFGLGGHPAFKCDYSKTNCELKFEKEENNIEFYMLEDGLVVPQKLDKSKFMENNKIKLHKDIFKNDAIIMKNLNSNKVYLIQDDKKILEFDFSGFKYLAIWSKENAPFVCIEPWMNTTDKIDSDGVFKNKEDILELDSNKEFEIEYKIKFEK
ncbi:MAG: aldose 1-epimerase family protein [Clostridia bacterium]|nr:aldose 1-epimerase family protein [Clostridia bacterium]